MVVSPDDQINDYICCCSGILGIVTGPRSRANSTLLRPQLSPEPRADETFVSFHDNVKESSAEEKPRISKSDSIGLMSSLPKSPRETCPASGNKPPSDSEEGKNGNAAHRTRQKRRTRSSEKPLESEGNGTTKQFLETQESNTPEKLAETGEAHDEAEESKAPDKFRRRRVSSLRRIKEMEGSSEDTSSACHNDDGGTQHTRGEEWLGLLLVIKQWNNSNLLQKAALLTNL